LTAEVRVRPLAPTDLEALAQTVHDGFVGYGTFAPGGWEPPPREPMRDELAALLPREDFWCLLAEVDGEPAGHVAFLPAEASRWSISEPGVAHLLQLFLRPAFHGTGLAAELLERALEEMRSRGFTVARLFTPAGYERARRFYEREGWRAAGEPFHASELGLELIEYRRDVA
jgi:GNAT superfamily N-acetyltransferase